MTTLAELTTLRVGGPITRFIDAPTEEALIGAVRDADQAGIPLLIVGGGSNILASDAGFDGSVIHPTGEGTRIVGDAPGGRLLVEAEAGALWDDFVSWTLTQGLSGVEALSGIPGTVGATPVQNVGAYGHEVGESIATVRAWDRATGRIVTLERDDMDFSYRSSIIKRSVGTARFDGGVWGPTGRWVVLSVTFSLEKTIQSAPVLYAELATRLGIEAGQRADARLVRETVLSLRASKGMVLNDGDHDSWSAGSFFTNPILSAAEAEALPADAPRFPAGDGRVKTSAAWLIDHAGCARGFYLPEAGDPPRASLSTKHVLALTNRGGATSADIEALARAVRSRVYDAYGVTLVPEPVAVGITW